MKQNVERGLWGGCMMWYQDGVLHRTDGPAEVHWRNIAHPTAIWWIDGKIMTPEVYFNEMDNILASASEAILPSTYDTQDGPEVSTFADSTTTTWLRNGKVHRNYGQPALVKVDRIAGIDRPSIRIEWRHEGKLHRDYGPAVVSYDALTDTHTEEWYFYDNLHRSDGPAFITEGRRDWYEHGKLVRTDTDAESEA